MLIRGTGFDLPSPAGRVLFHHLDTSFLSSGCISRSLAPEVRKFFRKNTLVRLCWLQECIRALIQQPSGFQNPERAYPSAGIFSAAICNAGLFLRSSPQVFFCSISKERQYCREKYRRWNIQGFFGGLNPDYFREFFRVPSISSEHLEILQRKSTESKTNLYIQ